MEVDIQKNSLVNAQTLKAAAPTRAMPAEVQSSDNNINVLETIEKKIANKVAKNEKTETTDSSALKAAQAGALDSNDPRKKLENLSEQAIMKAVEKANKQLLGSHRSLDVSVHERTKRVMVKVVDSDSEKVIREIPPEKSLDFIANILELAGILVDEKS